MKLLLGIAYINALQTILSVFFIFMDFSLWTAIFWLIIAIPINIYFVIRIDELTQ